MHDLSTATPSHSGILEASLIHFCKIGNRFLNTSPALSSALGMTNAHMWERPFPLLTHLTCFQLLRSLGGPQLFSEGALWPFPPWAGLSVGSRGFLRSEPSCSLSSEAFRRVGRSNPIREMQLREDTRCSPRVTKNQFTLFPAAKKLS